jgi:hypothetical protein
MVLIFAAFLQMVMVGSLATNVALLRSVGFRVNPVVGNGARLGGLVVAGIRGAVVAGQEKTQLPNRSGLVESNAH